RRRGDMNSLLEHYEAFVTRHIFRLSLVPLLLQGLLDAQTVSVIVPSTAGPWIQASNPRFTYGVGDNDGPVVIDASSGIPFTPGSELTVAYLDGRISAGPLEQLPFQDANGQRDYPTNTYNADNGNFPAYYMERSVTVYLVELVGTFANNGVIVGTP